MSRRLVPVLVALLAFSVAADTASARALSKHAALVKTGKLAKRVAAETGASYWFAGACKRRSAHKFACWGGVADSNGGGCIQKVVVTASGRKLHARRTGRTYCGEVPSGSGGGTGDGGGSQVVCAIRQSVCI